MSEHRWEVCGECDGERVIEFDGKEYRCMGCDGQGVVVVVPVSWVRGGSR